MNLVARTVALALAAACSTAIAATFQVTKTADTADGACDSDCSLREAITAANHQQGLDYIVVGQAVYPLAIPGDDDTNAGGDLDVTDDVVIYSIPPIGVIDAGRLDRALHVLPGAKVHLFNINVLHGRAALGGGIYNQGELLLERTVVAHNQARSGGKLGQGGGIYNTGKLTLLQSDLSGNVATNVGGGSAWGFGGGLYNAPGASVVIDDSSVEGNDATGASGQGYGGGVLNRGTLTVRQSLFARNSAQAGTGSAILNIDGGALHAVNSTFSHNGADGAEGTIANGTLLGAQIGDTHASNAELQSVTVVDNNGGGVYDAGPMVVRNTLIGGNYCEDGNGRRFDCALNCTVVGAGAVDAAGVLLGADGNCPGQIQVPNDGFMKTVVMPLDSYGGWTRSHTLRPESPAIDSGTQRCPHYDQRNITRPRDGDKDGVVACDIGAVELKTGY